MSNKRNRSFLSWLFFQEPIPKKVQKPVQIPPAHVQSSPNIPPNFPQYAPPITSQNTPEQSLCWIRFFVRSENREDYITVNTFPATIGRVHDGETTIVIEDKSISRCHAIIDYRNNTFFAIDTASKNGVKLAGRTLIPGEAVPINKGDILKLGRVVMHIDELSAEPVGKERKTEMVFDYTAQTEHIPHNSHEPSATPYVPTSAPPMRVEKFCGKCGEENRVMKNFCRRCGNDLRVV